ncbi:MAG: hypothetical protein RB191_17150 [Terriglobia bacterium]|nr:hypothetical protein [Terriglobia bacterium]
MKKLENNTEYDKFNPAIDAILKADPKAAKDAMEVEKRGREERRKAKRASADRATTGKD